MGKQRIEFIDLAKGICIILIVIGHCGVNIGLPGFCAGAVMPWFFIISGLFFKTGTSVTDFVIKKINTVLIPFLFFYFTAYYNTPSKKYQLIM